MQDHISNFYVKELRKAGEKYCTVLSCVYNKYKAIFKYYYLMILLEAKTSTVSLYNHMLQFINP